MQKPNNLLKKIYCFHFSGREYKHIDYIKDHFLDNIKPSCNTSVSEGSGLFWSISEPSPKPKR